MKNLHIITALALALGGCSTVAAVNTGVGAIVTADKLLSDKCGYLVDVVRFAPLAVGLHPAAPAVAERAISAAESYCTGARVTDIGSALNLIERIIVASRPLAQRLAR